MFTEIYLSRNVVMLMATVGSFYKIENRLFVFCGILERGVAFFLISVVEGLNAQRSARPYPPPPVLSSSSRERRTGWTVPDGTKSRKCKPSTLCKHILTASERMIKRTQQNKYLVAFVGINCHGKNLFLLKMLGKRHILQVNSVRHA